MKKQILIALAAVFAISIWTLLTAPKENTNMNGQISYYGIDESLQTIEHGPISLENARSVVHERFAKLKPQYETAEEALAETMFGFSRSNETFIEICIHTPSQISFKLEFPRSKRFLIFQNLYQKEVELNSKNALIQEVKGFFENDVEAYRENFEHRNI